MSGACHGADEPGQGEHALGGDDLQHCLFLLGQLGSSGAVLRAKAEEAAADLRQLCALNGGEEAARSLDSEAAPWLLGELRALPAGSLLYGWSSDAPLAGVLRKLAAHHPAAAGALLLGAIRMGAAGLAELLLRCGAPAFCTDELDW